MENYTLDSVSSGSPVASGPRRLYSMLLNHFGRIDWWSTKRGFSPPELEVCIGAILTQNTNWKNVEKALDNLLEAGILSREDLLETSVKKLEKLIRPSGFFRQKAGHIRRLLEFSSRFGDFSDFLVNVEREELLGLRGIGPETADSMLLYAGNRPFFVVDAYTKRLFQRVGLGIMKYGHIQGMVERELPGSGSVFKEFHALIVEHSKKFCKKHPSCIGCPLDRVCRKESL